ncbi:MAG: Mur ligase family protein [Actinomycetes bacterium]
MTATGRRLRIDRLPAGGGVHAVGAAGLETASMVRYLVEGDLDDVVLHDASEDFDAAFWAAHRFQPAEHRIRSRVALARCRDLRVGPDYLADIESAAVILVPVSWFLHPVNSRLEPLQPRFIYYPDACFDLWGGPVIGVTGSYGKTTITRFAAALVDGISCGNDRESFSDLAALAGQPRERCMAFEVSNRHLRNGFRRILDVGVLTGITLNHEPDHGSFQAYREAKYSLAANCCDFLCHAAVPATFPDAARIMMRGRSYGNGGDWRLVTEAIEGPEGSRCPFPGAARLSALDQDNAVAAAVAALLCGASVEDVEYRSTSLPVTKPRYRHTATDVTGQLFINDAASCMPASTAALVATLDRRFVLICGGDRQRYRPGEFDPLAAAVRANPHAALVCTIGAMAANIEASLWAVGFDRVVRCARLEEGVEHAMDVTGAVVVFSPGCGAGSMFADKYTRGEAFDDAVSKLVSGGQAVS